VLKVGRLWFDSLAESNQRILKVDIHTLQLPCLTFSIKEGLCEDRPASSLVVSFMGKALNRIASTYEWIDGRNRWQFDLKAKKVHTSLSPSRVTLMNKRVPKQGRRQ